MYPTKIQEAEDIAKWFIASGGIQSRYYPETNQKISRLSELVIELMAELKQQASRDSKR